ncbi:MAG: MFS family permease [Francisellaceae bacterium]|jgi:MFS family permease
MLNSSMINLSKLLPIWLIWIASSLFYEHQYFFRVIINTIAPKLKSDFNIELTSIEYLISLFFFSYMIFLPLAGILVKKYPKQNILLIAVVINQIGIIFCYFSISIHWLIVSQILFGASGPCALIISLSYIKELNLKRYTVLLNSITLSFGGLGVYLAGQPFFSLMTLYDWRTALLIFSLVNIVIIIMILLSAIKSNTLNYSHSQHILTSAPKKPINLKHYFNWKLWGPSLYGLFQFLPMISFISSWQVPFMRLNIPKQENYALDSIVIVFIGLNVGLISLGILCAYGIHKRVILMFSSALGCIAFTVIIFAPITNFYLVSIVLFLLGFSMSSYTVSTSIVQATSNKESLSTSLGINLFLLNIGGLIMLFITTAIMKYDLRIWGHPELLAFHYTYIFIPISLSIAFILAIFIPIGKKEL